MVASEQVVSAVMGHAKRKGPPDSTGTETLSDVAIRLRKAMTKHGQAEIRIACELMKMVDCWDDVWRPQDPENRTAVEWIGAELRQHGFEYYARIARNVAFVGERNAYRMDREALQRLCARAKTKEDLDIVMPTIHQKFNELGKLPIPVGIMQGLCEPLASRRKSVRATWEDRWRDAREENAKLKARIDRLERQVRELGAVPVE